MPERASVRGLSVYEESIRRLERFCVTHPAPESAQMLSMLGFHQAPEEGQQILPGSMGPFTDFNVNGRIVVRTDLPKASESRMVWGRWKDWGQSHPGIRHLTITAYPRQRTPAPYEYLTVVACDGVLRLSSRPLSIQENTVEEIVHVLNIFLEIFQDLTISSIDLVENPPSPLRKLHWRVLPHSQYPFEIARRELETFLLRLGEEQRRIIEHRVEHITQHSPDVLALGVGGFRDYFVFGFSDRGLYILESPHLGNATYVFKDDGSYFWSLSKAEILDEKLHHARVIHNHRWSAALREVIRAQPNAEEGSKSRIP